MGQVNTFNFSCNEQFTPIGGSSVAAITPNSFGITFSNQNILITGSFLVDENINFVNCKVQMGPDAEIVTVGNVRIKASNTVFAGCGSNWLSINVRNKANFQFNKCLIRDARFAGIRFTDGYNSNNTSGLNYIVDCVFIHDNVGVTLLGRPSRPVFWGNVLFYGNQFLESGENEMPGTPAPINMLMGMYLQDATASIGRRGSKPNFFELPWRDGSDGILANGSNLTIVNSVFDQIGGSANSKGHGIYATFSRLTVGSTDERDKCTFSGNRKAGIASFYTRRLEVRRCDFNNLGKNQQFAILSRDNTTPAEILIDDNTIANTVVNAGSGIVVERPYALLETDPETKITNNKINLSGGRNPIFGFGLQEGIYVTCPAGIAKNKMFITGNIIRFANNMYRGNGIYVQGNGVGRVKGYKIISNQVYFDQAQNIGNANDNDYQVFGIALVWANSGVTYIADPYIHEVSGNTVKTAALSIHSTGTAGYSPNPHSTVQCGFHIEDSPFAKVTGNTVDKTFRGFHMWKDNNNCDFACNTMQLCHTGFCGSGNGNDGGDISNQVGKANIWEADSYLLLGAAIWNGLGDDYVQNPAYRFFCNPNFPNHFPPDWEPILLFADDFEDPILCGAGGKPLEFDSPTRYLSGSQIKLINGVPLTGLSPVEVWDEKRNLNERLLSAPVIATNFSNASAWINQEIGTSAYQFAQAERSIAQALNNSLSLAAQYSTKQRQTDSIYYLIQTITNQIQSGSVDSIQMGIDLNNQFNSFVLLENEIKDIRTTLQQDRLSQLSAIQPQISSLPAVETYEISRKQVLQAAVHALKNEVINATEAALLYNIADGCYPENGESVFLARQLLPDSLVNTLGHVEDIKWACTQERNADVKKNHPTAKLTLFPNPVAEELYVSTDSQDDGFQLWQIFDIAGHLITESKVTKQASIVIDVHSLPKGSFIFRGTTANGQVLQSHFVVIHSF